MSDEPDVALVLAQLDKRPEWGVLVEIIRKRREGALSQILSGRLTPDDYHRQAGYVRGLDTILSEPHKTRKAPTHG